MTTTALTELIKKADALTPEEQLRLANHLVGRVLQHMPEAKPRRKWEDLIGLLPYPALGEDAQAYISRTRREGDERRPVNHPRSTAATSRAIPGDRTRTRGDRVRPDD